jgi:hypothetical protein
MRSPVPLCFGALLLIGACSTNQAGNVAAIGLGDLSFGKPSFQPVDRDLREACGSGEPTVLGNAMLGRRPYLQSVAARSAQVLWTSEDAAALAIRPATAASATTAGAIVDSGVGLSGRAQWISRVSDLEPSTTYCYRVVGADDSEPWTEWTGFRTAPINGEPVVLTVLGDLGENTEDQNELLRVLENLPAQALLLTGDLAYPNGTLLDFEQNYFGVYASVMGEVPFFPVGGNHDQGDDMFRQVMSLPENGGPEANEGWYSFDWGDVHIVGLDTERVGSTQAAWLERDLAAHADARWTMVMLHRPPYSNGDHGDTALVKEWFVPIFERAGVDLVLAGHDHDYERFEPKNGVLYIVTGGGGRGTRPVTPGAETAYAEDVIHLVHLRATQTELTGWAVDAVGGVFDTFRVVKQ